ncbi:MAG TPA: hypothetical protein VFQ25_01070 [Ktedonobacterales bacterium]|nr:hypothetical protein [Ktedonobacterales bacterium]
MSDPGATPDARNGQPFERASGAPGAADGRAGLDGQRAWNGAPATPPTAPAEPLTPYSALAETQPRLATPPFLRAARRARNVDMDAGDGEDTRKRRRVTDSARMPALRLNRRDRAPRAERTRRMVYDTERAPGYLRLVRLVAGLGALALAWGVALGVTSLADDLWGVVAHQPVMTERFALYLLAAVGIAWLAVVGLALVMVGAFSLFLGLAHRSW